MSTISSPRRFMGWSLYGGAVLALLVAALGLLFPGVAQANPNRLPDDDYNPAQMRGVISTGQMEPGGSQNNDYFGPNMWVKAYSDQRVSRTFTVTFEGGPQRGEGDDDAPGSTGHDKTCDNPNMPANAEASNSDHNAPGGHGTKREIDIYQGSKNGGRQSGGPSKTIGNFYNDHCFYRSITIDANLWSKDPEDESGRYMVLIRLSIWQNNKLDGTGNGWNQTSGSASSHTQHPNHPSAGFVLKGQGGLVFGNWALERGDGIGQTNDSGFFTPDRSYGWVWERIFSSYVKGGVSPGSHKKRVFKFAPSCAAPATNVVWLKWWDDDFVPGNEDTYMAMTVEERPAGSGAWTTIKTISGMNKTYADRAGLPKNSLFRQENKNNPYGYNTANGGEGFGGRGGAGKVKITMKRGYEYRWTFKATGSKINSTSHRYGNRMGVWFPFDSAFSNEKNCLPPPPVYQCGTLSTDQPLLQRKDAATLRMSIDKVSGGTANFPTNISYSVPGVGTGTASRTSVNSNSAQYTAYIGANKLIHAKRYAVSWSGLGLSCPGTIDVFDLPYFKVYGSSIRAGGNFDSTQYDDDLGSEGNGWLAGWYNNNGGSTPGAGSSTNLSAIAMIKITGVASAQGTYAGPWSPIYATFANSSTPSGSYTSDALSPALGGYFGAGKGFYESKPNANATQINTSTIDANLGSGSYSRDGDLTIRAGELTDVSPGVGKNVSIHVKNGNVRIVPGSGTSLRFPNYDGTTPKQWDFDKAPSFTLVVTGGNIYIDPAIKGLQGVYVAKKDKRSDNTVRGGTIYTCARGAAPYPANSLYFLACHNKLTVYGSFVADQINLMRTYGTLVDSLDRNASRVESPTDLPNGYGSLLSCLGGGGSTDATRWKTIVDGPGENWSATCAAEEFNFTPLMYLSNPLDQLPNNGALRYDSIVSLPPVL